jgi:hypothetical protein
MDQSAIVSEKFKGCVLDILNRPVMSFLLQQHNLEALQLAMRQALRKAACRVHAMQVKMFEDCYMPSRGSGMQWSLDYPTFIYLTCYVTRTLYHVCEH